MKASKSDQKKKEKLPQTKKQAAALTPLIMRLERIRQRLERWNMAPPHGEKVKQVVTALAAALARLGEVQTGLFGVPDDYEPKPPKQHAHLLPGQVVAVREARMEIYADVIDPRELAKLTIVRAGKQVLVQTPGGSQLILPRGHIRVAM